MTSRTQVSYPALLLHFAVLLNALALRIENVVAPPADSAFPMVHRALQLSFAIVATLAWLELLTARLHRHRTWFSLRPAQLRQFLHRPWNGIVVQTKDRPVVLPLVMSASLIVATIATVLSVPDFVTFDLFFQPRGWVVLSVNGYHVVIGMLALLGVTELISGLAFLWRRLHVGPPAGGHHV